LEERAELSAAAKDYVSGLRGVGREWIEEFLGIV
jgi:hypothetical protein